MIRPSMMKSDIMKKSKSPDQLQENFNEFLVTVCLKVGYMDLALRLRKDLSIWL